MKNFLYLLGTLCLALVAAFLIRHWLQGYDTPGYVLIGIGHWSMETTFVVFAVALVIVFYFLYFFFRLLGWLIRLPGQLKARGKNIKFNRSQEALIAGLVDSAEGNWEKAEKILIKHASHSGAPLIHYLTAAKAAQSRGAYEKRDEYLQKAAAQSPGSDIAIALTQAELLLSGNQFEEALETLTRLHSINPSHASVLKLLHQTYRHIGDWESVRTLLPSLHGHKVLMEAEVKLLETETFSRLLRHAAESGQSSNIRQLWSEIPDHIKRMHGIPAIYFAAMIDAGAGSEIFDDLVNMLSVEWDDTLVVLYGSIQYAEVFKQLEIAEQWLSAHSHDAILLSVLGKLCLRCNETTKAQTYFTDSIRIEPTVDAYQYLGDLLFSQDDKDNACECYKAGLELSSSAIVKRIDTITE